LRTRRAKSKNFHDDYVYDEKMLKDTISMKNVLNGGLSQAEQKGQVPKQNGKKAQKKVLQK